MADKTDPKPDTDDETKPQAETGPGKGTEAAEPSGFGDDDTPKASAEAPADETPEQPGSDPEQPAEAEEPRAEDRASEPETEPEAESEPEPEVETEVEPQGEPEAEPEAETQGSDAAPAPQPVERVIEKRGGFFPALIGGVLAAALGFAAARTEILDPVLPQALKSGTSGAAITALQSDVSTTAAALDELRGTVSDLSIPDLAPVESRLDALSETVAATRDDLDGMRADLADLSGQIAPLEARLTELEKRPIAEGVSDAAISAYERELAAMQDTLATQRAEVEKLIAETRKMEQDARAMEARAAEAAQLAANRNALARLRGALDSGGPFAGILDELRSGGVTVPDALSAAATDGVVTLAALRDTFPPAARDALAAARAGTVETDRSLGAFLRRQLGARSVEPREGDDPDAVLSRAEAALTHGRLAEALDEIAALSEPARAAMADWTALARLRLSALEATETLAHSLNTN